MTEQSEVARHAAKRIGTVLRGKYRIDRVLGVGGMAVVYAASVGEVREVDDGGAKGHGKALFIYTLRGDPSEQRKPLRIGVS